MGHIFRMRALGLALGRRGYDVRYCTAGGTAGARVLAETGQSLRLVDEGAPLVPESESLRDIEVLVIDRLDQGEELARLRRDWSGRIVCFDDTKSGLEIADVVVNAIANLSGNYDKGQCRAKLYEGPDYIVLDEGIGRFLGASKPVGAEVERLLLAFGGSDDHELAARILPILGRIPALRKVELRVRRGPACVPSAGLQSALANYPFAAALTLDGELFDELSQADLVLCIGGVMLYELAALGRPHAAFAAEPHEVATIRWFAARGATVALGLASDLGSASDLEELIGGLLEDGSRRAALAAAGPRLVDAGGLARVVGILEGLFPS